MRSLLGLMVAVALGGCSSVGGSAIRTGPVQLPAHAGPVAVYASAEPPPGATSLGVVEVHAAQQEATVEVLLPQFVAKVAQIGGDVAVVDGIRARFDVIPRTHVETYYYPCAFGRTCAGTRVYAANDELMIVSIFGRAFTTRPVKGDDRLTPLAPAEPPPPGLEEPAPAPQPPEAAPTPAPGGSL